MNLDEIIKHNTEHEKRKDSLIREERIHAVMPALRQYIAFWREYPDLFIDFMQTGGNPELEKSKTIKLFFYQRVILRCCARYKQVFIVIPRGASKSFLNVLLQIVRCILYPGVQLFVTAEGKAQGASILSEKVDEICEKIPAFKREIIFERGKGTIVGKDKCVYKFTNGSRLDSLGATEKTRGQRRHGGTFEEAVLFDGRILQEVLIPVMNIARQCKDGTMQMDETPNMSQIFLTTAGSKSTFCYRKLMTFLTRMITEPEKAIVLGGTYKIPLALGLFNKDFIKDQKRDESFDEASFLREYCSQWTGSSAGSFFDMEAFVNNRQLGQAEFEAARETNSSYYVLSMDVGRNRCPSILSVIKVVPQAGGFSKKRIVNIFALHDMHFEDQAIFAKRQFLRFKARTLVVDANGLGAGIVDYLVKTQICRDTGEELPDFGVINDPTNEFRRFRTENTVLNSLYLIKANAELNTEAHSNLQFELTSGRLKFLISEADAKKRLLDTAKGRKMTSAQKDEYLMPFVSTSMLERELDNLVEDHEGIGAKNIVLKPALKTVKHDRVSSLEYGLWYIKKVDEENKKKSFKVSDFIFMTRR